jgi:hypothetical protein
MAAKEENEDVKKKELLTAVMVGPATRSRMFSFD